MPQRDDLELAKFEEFSDYAIRTIETEHARVHEGKAFIAGGLFLAVANNGVVEILLQGGGNSAHAVMQVAAGGNCEIHTFEDTTFSVAGGAITNFNKNRYSSVASLWTLTDTPTITADGTELPEAFLAGGSGGNANGGTSGGFAREIILNGGKNYLVRIKNVAGIAITISANLEWYEPSAVAP